MTTYIALLRAVNLGTHNKVAMRDLCELLTTLGMQGTRSVLQSGNVVFRTGLSKTAELERLLEDAADKRLGLNTDFFVRSARDWEGIIARSPFPDEAARDPSHVLVIFLKDTQDRAAVTALQQAITGREVVRAEGRQVYIVYPDGIGRSRLSNAPIEKKLGTRGTGRNWNTILKLASLAKCNEPEPVCLPTEF
jgi:uncharacterized protein (DUF1697 family)